MNLRLIKSHAKKVGLPPGSSVLVGDKKTENIEIELFDYNQDSVTNNRIENLDEIAPLRESESVSWININGLHDVDTITKIGSAFDIHPLIIEDILNTDHRPKSEILDRHIFITLKMIHIEPETDQILIEQVSIVLGHNYVLTFQESKGDIFDTIRDRILHNKGRIRKFGADYLTYALIDTIIDTYFLILDRLNDRLEVLENDLIDNPDQAFITEIQRIKRELLFLRKSVWPLRELISTITREETPFFTTTTIPFLRDLYDHTIQIIDTVETMRDMISGLLDVHLSSLGNKTNDVMKVLTIIATIFIPLTFLAGIYGMNFEFMPELKWHFAYPLFWGIIFILFFGMMFYFKRKKWF